MSSINRTYYVFVRDLEWKVVVVDLCNTEEQFKNMTVLQLKEKIKGDSRISFKEDENNRLHFRGKHLEDSKLLIAYGIEDMSSIQIVRILRGGGNPEREDGGMGGMGGKSKKKIDECALNIFINLFQIDEASLTTEARHQPEK